MLVEVLTQLIREAGFQVLRVHLRELQPSITLVARPEVLVEECDRLVGLLACWGIDVGRSSFGAPAVEAAYCPAERVAVIEIIGVDDSMLRISCPVGVRSA